MAKLSFASIGKQIVYFYEHGNGNIIDVVEKLKHENEIIKFENLAFETYLLKVDSTCLQKMDQEIDDKNLVRINIILYRTV